MSRSRSIIPGLVAGVALVAAPAAHAVSAQPMAVLSAPATAIAPAPSYTRLAATPSTVVAEGAETDVWTAAPDGWDSGGPAATLVDAGAPAGASDSSGVGLSMSRDTVLAGFGTAGVDSVEDVFVRSAGGWAGAVAPAARLAPPAGRSALLSGVIRGRLAVAQTTAPFQPLGPIAVYARPPGGWAGTVPPRARLVVAGGSAVTGSGLAIGAHAIFVSGQGVVWVFAEPRRGWSGTIHPSARLRAPAGPMTMVGTSVLVGNTLFPRPTRGWSGTVKSSGSIATQFDAEDQAGSPGMIVSSRAIPVASGCAGGCPITIDAVIKPARGWRGRLHPTTLVHMVSERPSVPLALAGPDLFLSGGADVRVYGLTGTPPATPAAAGRAPGAR
jgi:hypothetical protein